MTLLIILMTQSLKSHNLDKINLIDCLHHQNELCKCELMNIKVHHKCPIITCTVITMHCQQLSLCICLQQKSSLFLPSSQQSSRAASLDFSWPLLQQSSRAASLEFSWPLQSAATKQSSLTWSNIIRAAISHISGSPRSLQQSADPAPATSRAILLVHLSNTQGSGRNLKLAA